MIDTLENGQSGRDWLAGSAPTIAHMVMYPYTSWREVGVTLEHRLAIRVWAGRFEQLPGYVAQET